MLMCLNVASDLGLHSLPVSFYGSLGNNGCYHFTDLLSSSLRTEAPGNVSAKGLVSDYLILTDKKGFYANIERKSSKFRNHTVKPAVRRLQDIPRVIEYCNSPLEPVTGSEGKF